MSPAPIPYHIVDVFSSTAYKGNPLAVVDTTTTTLTTPQMQLMARQFNLSETTFVCPPTSPDATWRLRSFLPNGVEVFGAGHNSLGAWWWLAHAGLCPPRAEGRYTQQLGTDVLPVWVSSSSTSEEIMISMRQGELQLLNEHPDPAALATALGISVAEISLQASFAGTRVTVDQARVATTSAARHLLVPVRDREALYRTSFADAPRIESELVRMGSQGSGVYVYTAGEGDRLETRFFSPGMGMEDPATGSAAGPLVAYLSRVASGTDGVGEGEVQVVQGVKAGRECVMRVGVGPEGVSISGTGVLVATGTMVVPSEEIAFH